MNSSWYSSWSICVAVWPAFFAHSTAAETGRSLLDQKPALVSPENADEPRSNPSWNEAEFPLPPSLESAVGFWMAVFSRYRRNQTVLHDRDHLNLIWDVIDLPTADNGTLLYKEASRLTRTRTGDLTARLRRLQNKPIPQDGEDESLLGILGGPQSPRLNGAWRRIRGQRGVADNFRVGIQRAQPWLPQLRTILREEGVPGQLLALAFVESMFNPKARSSAGAAGLWQLMPATARQLGLTVTRKNDERLNVLKSTRAAARMLRDNHRMLGNWPLAVTGYNHGPYGVRRAVKKVGSTDLTVLIEQYDQRTWGFASKNFYAELLAAIRLLGSRGDAEPWWEKAEPPAASLATPLRSSSNDR